MVGSLRLQPDPARLLPEQVLHRHRGRAARRRGPALPRRLGARPAAGRRPPAGVEVPDGYRRLTLGHCLTMATGHDVEAWTDPLRHAAGPRPTTPPTPCSAAILARPAGARARDRLGLQPGRHLPRRGAVRGVTGAGAALLRAALPLLDPLGADTSSGTAPPPGASWASPGSTSAPTRSSRSPRPTSTADGGRAAHCSPPNGSPATSAPTGLPTRGRPQPGLGPGLRLLLLEPATATAATAPTASSPSCSPSRTSPSRSPPRQPTCRACSTSSGSTCCRPSTATATNRPTTRSLPAPRRAQGAPPSPPRPAARMGAWVRAADSALPAAYGAVEPHAPGRGAAGGDHTGIPAGPRRARHPGAARRG